MGSLGRVDHENEETSLDFEVAEDWRAVFHGDAGDKRVRVTGPGCALGRRPPEPVPELWIFLAEIVSSSETISDDFPGDVDFDGKAYLMKHDVIAIAVADERLTVAEYFRQGVEQPGVGEQWGCQAQGVVIEDQLFAGSLLLAREFLEPFEQGF
ncbi:hypothetical protein [Rhizobium tibeticum]|uniref:hypothetical protein n=1 Tax=Rhizobium tibeticum TaxID=501024 RepID=UPI001FCDDF53|nr:hypothetical protein [Rhizobium tibeticum]